MPGERNAVAPWGEDGRAGAPAPVWLRGLLALAVLAAFGVVVIEIARLGPFAPARTGFIATPLSTPRAPATPALAARLPGGDWQWQLLATGTPAGEETGATLVRAWQLTGRCRPGGGCTVQFARQLVVPSAPNDGSDRTLLERGRRDGTATRYRARFAAVATRCTYPDDPARSTPTTTFDHFVLSWSAAGALSATEQSRYVCGGHVYASDYDWSTVRVTPSPAPAITADPRHAASATAFVRAATGVCRAVNADAEPLARRVAADERVVRGSAGNAAKAGAEADIAAALPALVPLSGREYTETPQPPAGPLDRLWLRDIALGREQIGPGSALIAALAGAASAAGAYYANGDPAEQQRALAEAFLVSNDAGAMRAAALASLSIERDRLHLPSVCIDPPAVRSLLRPTPSIPASA